MKKFFKKMVGIVVSASIALSSLPTLAAESESDWAIYVYMCGSDLESEGGCTTSDILEMLDADIPDNVKVIIMTGGASAWDPKEAGANYNEAVGYNAYITPQVAHNQIFEVSNDKMTLLKTYDKYMSMGDAKTAETFLKDAAKYAPAKHTMVEFWDHGGALSGAEKDELTDDLLSIPDIAEVLEEAKNINGGNKVDIVGFDACLMSAIEVGYTFSPYADYLLASEEAETGYGWDYHFLSNINASSTAVDVGKSVIDSYAYSQNRQGDWSKNVNGTLALTDLSRMDDLAAAFDELASKMLEESDDPETLVQMMRIAERSQSMLDGFGMIDLYDFAYNLKSIDSLYASATRFMKLLGTPPGVDSANYHGHVEKEDYVGWVSGDNPAVIYRGIGSKFNNCIGLTAFYPLSTVSGKTRRKYLSNYKYGVSDNYPLYIAGTTSLSNAASLFDGKITDDYDDDNDLYTMSIEPAEDVNLIKRVDYITTFTETDETNSEKTYLLGSEMIEDGWDENKFSAIPNENWYSVNGKPITVSTADFDFADGYNFYYYNIPAALVNNNGDETLVWLSCMYVEARDVDAVVNEEDLKNCEKMYINGFIPMSDGYMAERLYIPDDAIKIKPALAVFDVENAEMTGYKVYDDVIEIKADDDGNFVLPLDTTKLISNDTTYYESYFVATDIQNNFHISDSLAYYVFQSFDEFNIGIIAPQAYTGEPVEPSIPVLYHGDETLTEGVDYKVTYSNNVEKGTAQVTVTSLMDDVPGELTAEFTICDKADLAEETMGVLPDHEIITGCLSSDDKHYEYFEHISVLETAKYYYEHGYNLSAESLARLNDQYNKLLAYMNISLKNNGVEIIGEYGLFGATAYRSLIARSTAPVSQNANTALANAGKTGLVDCYYVGMYLPYEDNSLEIADMAEDYTVALKIALPSSVNADSFEIYRLTDSSAEPTQIDFDVINRNGEKYAIFDTNELGYFALFDTKEGYSDVPSNAWYADGVKYVTDNGLMSGIGNNLFAPDTPISRGMLVTVLYKMAGEPDVADTESFADIQEGAYFENAVAWAAQNGIVYGYTADKFEPYLGVTREQLATILQRYAKYKGSDVSASADITKYTDASAVQDYAVSAMQWACGSGIISGINGTLNPKGSATRAQTASILERMQ